MELKVQVPFEQLLTAVKTLTPAEKARLRQELDESKAEKKSKDEFIELLLNGPVYRYRKQKTFTHIDSLDLLPELKRVLIE